MSNQRSKFAEAKAREEAAKALAAGRVPPHALDAERAVLGGVLLENDAMNSVMEVVTKEDFYSEAHNVVFSALTDLFRAGKPMDTITLRELLVQKQKLASVGGDEYLLELTNTIPTVANIEEHARLVKERALVRRLISVCHEVTAKAYAGEYEKTDEFLDSAEKAVFDVAKVQSRNQYEHIKDVVLRTFTEIHESAQRGDKVTGLSTGFATVDEMTSGMHPGDLIIVAGRPGMGKTAFALCVAANAAMSTSPPKGVAVFSLEMPKEQLVKRMLCSEARVDGGRMRSGQLFRDDWPKLARAAGTLSELPIYIDDTSSLSIIELRSKTRRMKAQGELDLIVVDYLQLMKSGSRNDSREQEISEISRNLKALAKELSVPIIALSQLNRGVESRADPRPMISDLRESGAIEQDADTIWFVYRPEVYKKEDPDLRGKAELIIGKQRAGPTGTAQMAFINEYTRFENLARDDYGGGEFADG